MSISNLLTSEVKNQEWSHIYANQVETTGLISNVVLLGNNPNQYTLPVPENPIDIGNTMIVTSPGVLEFRDLRRMTMNFGATANGNPTWFIAGGQAFQARSATQQPGTNWKLPTTCLISHITITSNGSATNTQYNIYNNAGITHTFTFPANGVYDVPVNLIYVVGETMSISWLGVGTQPNETLITVFMTEV